MEKTDVSICLKKRKKGQKNIKKIIMRQKNLNITMNKIVFLIAILIVMQNKIKKIQ